MTGFFFPPPPPPPPKANSANGQPSTASRGGSDRGRGRGRGSSQQSDGSQRGGRGRGPHNHYQQGTRQPYQPGAPSESPWYSSNRLENGIDSRHQPPQSNAQQPAGSPPRTAASHKRKLDALRGPPQQKPENKPAPATAPAIPTFGVPLLPVQPQTIRGEAPERAAGTSKQKPPNRSLGLTPGTADPQYSSSDGEEDEGDVDEEAMYSELGEKLTFEHNGVVMSLNSQADLLAWKKERQRNWPTKARMVQKDEEKKRVGEERRRLLAGVDELYGTTRRLAKEGSNTWTRPHLTPDLETPGAKRQMSLSKPEAAETELEKTKREMAEQTSHLEELRRKVMKSEARNRQARESAERSQSKQDDASADSPPQSNESIAMAPLTEKHEDEAGLDGKVASEDEQSDKSSDAPSPDSSPESDSDDERPEELSTKTPTEPTLPEDKRPVCKYFRAGGRCRDGVACRFKHDSAHQREEFARQQKQQQQPAVQREGQVLGDQRTRRLEQSSDGKKTIYQRLVEQEEKKEDILALNVVRYLGGMGFFGAD